MSSKSKRRKNTRRHISFLPGILLFVCTVGIISAGCGGGSGGKSTNGNGTIAHLTAANLTGQWVQTNIGGTAPFISQTSPCPGQVLGVASCGSNDNILFSNDGTFIHQYANRAPGSKNLYIEQGTYSLGSDTNSNSSTLTLNVAANGADANGNGILDTSEVLPNSVRSITETADIQNGELDLGSTKPYSVSGNVFQAGGDFRETDSYRKL